MFNKQFPRIGVIKKSNQQWIPKRYISDLAEQIQSEACVGAGWNTSTIALRVIGGDKKEISNLRQQNMVAKSHGTHA
jgi:hypothetical protein